MDDVITIDSDQPKITKKDDKFDFAVPAESMAKSILACDYPDGFVFGIEGEWGSGKTSFINMVCESLLEQSPEFKIIEFKPWLHSSHENLIAAYFKLLRENAEDIFGDNNDIKEILGHVIDIFTPAVGAVVNLATAGVWGKSVEMIMDLSSEKLKQPPTLESQYNEIKKILREAREKNDDKRPILVVIDDLDRLDSDEIKIMLKLVKSVGNLPNVIYILAYNRDYIKKAIDKDMPQFLEKIVQLPIPIPKPTQNKLTTILTDYELKDFFNNINRNSIRWQEIIEAGIYYYIKNPRNISLLANTIKFRFSAINKNLDTIELFALEALRLFDTELWEWIKNNKNSVVGENDYNLSQRNKKTSKQDLEKSLSLPTPLSQNQKIMLIRLFPRLSASIDIISYGTIEPYHEVMRDKTIKIDSIAKESVYDTYFAQYPDKSDVSEADINDFLKNSQDKEKTIKTLQTWINRQDARGNSKIARFLDLLNFELENNPDHKPDKMLLSALIDVCDDINSLKRSSVFTSMPLHWQLLYSFRLLFEKIGKKETNAFLQDICNDEARISATTFLLYSVGYDMGKIENDDDTDEKIFLIEEADWEPLTKIIAPHIKSAFLTGAVGDFAKVIFAEFLAAHIFGNKVVKDMFKTAYKKSEKYVIKTVKENTRYVTTGSGNSGYEFATGNYKEPLEPYIMDEYAKKVDLKEQDEDTRAALTVFLDGIQKHRDVYKNSVF